MIKFLIDFFNRKRFEIGPINGTEQYALFDHRHKLCWPIEHDTIKQLNIPDDQFPITIRASLVLQRIKDNKGTLREAYELLKARK